MIENLLKKIVKTETRVEGNVLIITTEYEDWIEAAVAGEAWLACNTKREMDKLKRIVKNEKQMMCPQCGCIVTPKDKKCPRCAFCLTCSDGACEI